MHRATLTLALSLVTFFSLASSAYADVARCGRCSTSGLEGQGGIAAVMLGAGAAALLVARTRGRKPRS